MPAKNNLWRLDLLEVEFLKLDPRYSRTKLLLKSKKKSSLLPPTKNQALHEIDALKSDIFNKKLHSSLVKYKRILKKLIKSTSSKKNLSDEESTFIKSLDIDQITNIKIIKLLVSSYKIIPKKLAQDSEYQKSWKFIPSWIQDAITSKDNKFNQSNFYNSLNQMEKNYYSKLMNNKELLQITKIIENSLKIVLGPVIQVEKDEKKDIEDVESEESEEESGSESEEESGSDGDDESEDNEEEKEPVDFDEDDFTQFDALVAGSEDEDEDDKVDQEINYNEVTDTEPSEQEEEEESEDELFEHEKPKKEKKEQKEKKDKKDKKESKLPSLNLSTGYFSGGSSDSEPEDEIVKAITKPVKKNRRGQRARQKIWEAKFKTDANHIKKEKLQEFQERERKQKEYEERVKKREAKAKELEKTGANNAPLTKQRNFDGTENSIVISKEKPKLHPSWEAKKRQEDALKVKFEGKKIKF